MPAADGLLEGADAIYAVNVGPAALSFTPDFLIGYDDGNWPDAAAIAAEWPGKPVYRLNVFDDNVPGDGTDTEPGDTTIAQAVDMTRKELAAGVWRPIKYCPASWANQMVAAHTAAGISRGSYRLVAAHYAGRHICSAAGCGYAGAGADATQYADPGSFDRTVATPSFLPGYTPPARPVVMSQRKEKHMLVVADPDAVPGSPAGTAWLVFADRTAIHINTPAQVASTLAALGQAAPAVWGKDLMSLMVIVGPNPGI